MGAKKLLVSSAAALAILLSLLFTGQANAATDISDWVGFEETGDIVLQNDIDATSSQVVLDFNGQDKTIDGNEYSVNGSDGNIKGSLPEGLSLTLQNLGKVSDATAADNDFSYTDKTGNEVYKKIDKSVNSFTSGFITTDKSGDISVDKSVFSANKSSSTLGGGALLLSVGTHKETIGGVETDIVDNLNITDSYFINNEVQQTAVGGDTKANKVVLPNLSTKNYAEFAIGVDAGLNDKWGLSFDLNRRDTGREGWGGNFSVNCSFQQEKIKIPHIIESMGDFLFGLKTNLFKPGFNFGFAFLNSCAFKGRSGKQINFC